MTRAPSRLCVSVALLATSACASLPIVGGRAPERWGFTAPWDARSAASAREHAAALDGVVIDWIALDTLTGLPVALYRDSLSATLPAGVRRMALLTTFVTDRFNPSVVRRLALDPIALAGTATAIGERLRRNGARGLVIDFEGMTVVDTAFTRVVVSAIADAVRARDAGPVVVALPATDTSGYPARLFTASADLLLIMLYDQHWTTSPPGAIASPDWVRRALATRAAESGASRLVAALPLYGYLWRANAPASTISYDDARRLVAEAGVALERDPATSTLHATRAGADGWELWVSDAELLSVLEGLVSDLNVQRLAFWRLGLEDPRFWTTTIRPR